MSSSSAVPGNAKLEIKTYLEREGRSTSRPFDQYKGILGKGGQAISFEGLKLTDIYELNDKFINQTMDKINLVLADLDGIELSESEAKVIRQSYCFKAVNGLMSNLMISYGQAGALFIIEIIKQIVSLAMADADLQTSKSTLVAAGLTRIEEVLDPNNPRIAGRLEPHFLEILNHHKKIPSYVTVEHLQRAKSVGSSNPESKSNNP